MFFKMTIICSDMDSLPMAVYKQMQQLPEVCLYDLGIDINKKDEVVRI